MAIWAPVAGHAGAHAAVGLVELGLRRVAGLTGGLVLFV